MTAPRIRIYTFFASIAPLLLAACVAPGSLFGPAKDQGPAFRDPQLSLQAASGKVAAGQSTKAEVQAALGPARVVRFDSGYEVWLYRVREPGSHAESEFVLLFSPAGVLAKTRVRPPSPHPRV
jgi:hypothetical protein